MKALASQLLAPEKDYLSIQGYEIDQGYFLPKEMIWQEKDCSHWLKCWYRAKNIF